MNPFTVCACAEILFEAEDAFLLGGDGFFGKVCRFDGDLDPLDGGAVIAGTDGCEVVLGLVPVELGGEKLKLATLLFRVDEIVDVFG